MKASEPIARAPRALVVAYALACAVLLALVLTFSFGRDQGIYGEVAARWRQGTWPYAGAWDFKPPGIFLLFVAIQSTLGSGEVALRAAEVASLLLLLAASYSYARDVLRSEVVGLVGGFLALLTHVQLDFWHTAQPETFAAPWLFVALLLAEQSSLAAAAIQGILGGFLFLVKPPLGAAAAMPLLVAFARTSDRGAVLRRIAVAFAASLVPIAAIVFAFHAAGALGALHETLFVFAPGYTKLGWENETALTLVYRTLERTLTGFSGPISLGLLLRVASPLPWARSAGLLASLALCIVGTALQAKLFPYHFGAILPLAAVLAAEGYASAFGRSPFGGRAAIAAAALLAFVARGAGRDVQGTFLERSSARLRAFPAFLRGERASLDALDKAADLDIAANRALAAWFREAARPDEAVLLFGFEPSVYLTSGRAPASRYLYDVPLRATWSAEHRARFLADVRASKPAAIALERWDRMKMVTGSEQDSLEAAHAFPEFMALLEAGYLKIDDLGRFERWVRRAPETSASPPPEAPAASP